MLMESCKEKPRWDWRLGSARFNGLIFDDAPVVARLMVYRD